jgi:DNA-binding NtrC family response regulator
MEQHDWTNLETRESPPQAPACEGSVVIESPRMRALYALAGRLARTDRTVLIQGETGTGKELIARSLHAQGRRARGPFHPVNCGAIPETLIESVLFGHERGSFTGAHRRQCGAFESACGGTLFLDEIGELSPAAQAALLRALETRRIHRVGGEHEIEVDVRVIAATHRDLSLMVEQGRFRSDLLYRLNGITLKIPPLRERTEEIPALAHLFARREASSLGRCVPEFEPGALSALQSYAWPGNVRELHNAVMRALVHSDGSVIRREDLPSALGEEPHPCHSIAAPLPPQAGDAEGDRSFRGRVAAYERALLQEALGRTHGNRKRAAKLLDLPLHTFLRKLAHARTLDAV